MPAIYDKLGIRFQYPENWELDADEAAAGRASITVYTPGGGFWSVSQHGRSVEPNELASTALATMRQEYDDLDSEAAREQIGGVDLTGYDVNFYCLDLTNTARIRAGRTEHASILIICQAEDREFGKIDAVFQAMTVSLVGGGKRVAGG